MKRRIRNRASELEALRLTTLAITASSDRNELLRTIVEQAVKLLDARSGGIYEFNKHRGDLTVIVDHERNQLVGRSLRVGEGMAGKLIRENRPYLIVDDYAEWGKRSSALAEDRSFGAVMEVPLKWMNEIVGVIYVDDQAGRRFTPQDAQLLGLFADHAAIAYVNAQRLDQIRKANATASLVAQVTTLGDLDKTLVSVVSGIQGALECDAVVLYVYDEAKGKWNYPPTLAGVLHPTRLSANSYEGLSSLIERVFQTGTPYLSEDIEVDALFHGSRFTREEGIKSCAAIALRISDQKVGVMFVNYRRLHRFGPDEVASIQLFANQAAVAIRNAQLFDERTQKIRAQVALVELSQQFLIKTSLQETLDAAVSMAAELMGTEFSSAVLPTLKGRLVLSSTYGWEREMIGNLESSRSSQTGYTIERREPVVVDDYSLEERFDVPPIILEHHIRSGLSVPMIRAGTLVGAMMVYRQRRGHFSDYEVSLLSLIANQTAIAIERVEHYEAILRRSSQLRALYEASRAITRATLGSERKEILDLIAQEAAKCLTVEKGHQPPLVAIRLYNDQTEELVLESVYPRDQYHRLKQAVGEGLSVAIPAPAGRPQGLDVRTFLNRMPHIVSDVSIDPDYVQSNSGTRSQLAVPLVHEDKLIGVLAVESERLAAFDEDDMNTLEALCDLAVVAIQNARQYDDLKKTQGLVGASTALAWMGMTSSYWRHAVTGRASAIVYSLRLLADALPPEALNDSVKREISRIEALTQEIREKPITPPLSSEEGVELVFISQVVGERVAELRTRESYHAIEFIPDISKQDDLKVRANAQWLRQILDLLIDNAVHAMVRADVRAMRVTVRRKGIWAEIAIADTGGGIPQEILSRLFEHPVQKTESARGLGIGLLMARLIAQAYGGDVLVESTSSAGTTMVVRLPAEN